MQTQKPTLELLTSNALYRENPTALFHQLCGARPATLLLESADIDSKNDLKSLLLVDSALRITALGDTVTIEALTQNGASLLPLLDAALPAGVENTVRADARVLRFPPVSTLLDEDARLCSLSVFDAFRLLQVLVDVPADEREAMFFGGLFAYDLVAGFEDLPALSHDRRCPDYCFYLAETLLVIDHQKRHTRIQVSLFSADADEKARLTQRIETLHEQLNVPPGPLPVESVSDMRCECNQSDEEYGAVVRHMQKAIRAGEIFQVVPSRRFTLPCPSPLAAYEVLKKSNPSPYMFFMQDNDFALFGASPESSLKYDATSRQIEIYPIAGTRPRGRRADGSLDRDLDSRIELEMRTDHKELSEHLMLVDLARNDLARICTPGSRYVADLTKVDRYSFVMHLVSRVVGELRQDLDVLHAYRACMNMGTLSGAPKVRAMQLIADAEGSRRGSYGGAVGYFTAHGDLDTCIVIRSAWVEDGVATVQAGAGVVLDSVPQSEADETRNKARAVLRAIAKAHNAQETF
ncbi:MULTISPECIES: anthranilate synthase component 1 [Phytobacter]|uniref:Anthranilate synthase component 1 n=1 Tax=Phytobacter diazotrophicus TaxID=395631 RepID=A0ABN6LQC6_9ENTR|nr:MULTISPECIES: anthranilate synthase component 1 [Phytobacter]MDU4152149.1 anthranilate synthase component 1 [Enterobacteriaceae bacterium]MDU7379019.1 anthranilate synthase component 1 [Enterobacteriaceae bacterium]BBE78007.1 anthranilate synthase component 1 [Phytobacter sp. MRY16-398]BDD51381.1 anthranilate synthase component 1 [Phytobacter diazotrophicus]BEG82410.1 anthranilate synthase component 1 [Phytobacter diazotrophicus]